MVFMRIFNQCWMTIAIFLCTVVPLLADDETPSRTQVWVISYAIMLGFLTLTLFILLRRTNRNDSAFSFDELREQKEAELKKLKKH